jgi:hypothetical protein
MPLIAVISDQAARQLRRLIRCRFWVKMRNTHPEQMSSALPPKSDIARRDRHFAFVPGEETHALQQERVCSFTLSARNSKPFGRIILVPPRRKWFLSTTPAEHLPSGRTSGGAVAFPVQLFKQADNLTRAI